MRMMGLIVLIAIHGAAAAQDQISQNDQNIHLDVATKKSRIADLSADLKLYVPEPTFSNRADVIKTVSSWASPSAAKKSDIAKSAPETPKQANDQKTRLLAATKTNAFERYFGATQLKGEIVQQPNTVLVQTSSTSSQLIPNPDRVLFRASSTTTFSQVFLTSDDIFQQAQLEDKDPVTLQAAGLCSGKQRRALLDCAVRRGTRNRLQRIGAGFKTTFSYGQNPQIQQGVNVNNVSSAISKNLSLSGEVDFDPKGIFITGSDWKAALKSASSYGQADAWQFAKKSCDFSTAKCLRAFAGPSAWAVLIPQVQYSIRNQFDFFKSGATLVAAPFPTNSIQDLTVSFDLGRLVPALKARNDAYSALKDNTAPDPINAQRAAIAQKYIDWATEPERIEDDQWFEGFRKLLTDAVVAQQRLAHP